MKTITCLSLLVVTLAFAACQNTSTAPAPRDNTTPAGFTQGKSKKNNMTTSDAPTAPGVR